MKRLLMNGRFSANETEETLRANILKFSNPTKAFIEKTLEKSNRPQDYIIEAELYREFIIFCDSENLPSVRKGEFTQALIKEIPDVKQTKQRILGKNTPVYQFIKKFAPSAPPHLFDAAKNPKFLEINKGTRSRGSR